jgi:hypothetical protein
MEISSLPGEEVAAPGEGLSGAAGTGQQEPGGAGIETGYGRIPAHRAGKKNRRVWLPVLHYSAAGTRTTTRKREYRDGRALACRGERG